MAQFYTILSVVLVSLISFVGVLTIFLKKRQIQNYLFILVSFSVGALLGDAFIHLIPESYEKLGIGWQTSILVLLGILIFFILEKFVRWRHCHAVSSDHIHPLAAVNLIGDGVHNFIDGLLIGASFLVSIPIGIATTIAVILHEIPTEIGDCGVLLHAGMPLKKALFYNFLSASASIVGAIIVLFVGSKVEGLSLTLLPIAAGGFIYIAGSDLIPELHHETKLSISLKQILAIIAGVLLMLVLIFVG